MIAVPEKHQSSFHRQLNHQHHWHRDSGLPDAVCPLGLLWLGAAWHYWHHSPRIPKPDTNEIMSTLTIKLPESLKNTIEKLAAREGYSVSQFLASAAVKSWRWC